MWYNNQAGDRISVSMKRLHDKYGRGSAAANGVEFVDLEPGDTFSGLEAKLWK